MGNLGEEFIVADLPEDNGFDPIPAGTYDALVQRAELKDTSTGGKMISLQFQVRGPSHADRVVFGNINIRNANPKAEEIGRQQLGSLARAIGLAKVSDTAQLENQLVSIKVAVKNDPTYGPRNEVKGFKPSGQRMAAPAVASSDKPPWA